MGYAYICNSNKPLIIKSMITKKTRFFISAVVSNNEDFIKKSRMTISEWIIFNSEQASDWSPFLDNPTKEEIKELKRFLKLQYNYYPTKLVNLVDYFKEWSIIPYDSSDLTAYLQDNSAEAVGFGQESHSEQGSPVISVFKLKEYDFFPYRDHTIKAIVAYSNNNKFYACVDYDNEVSVTQESYNLEPFKL